MSEGKHTPWKVAPLYAVHAIEVEVESGNCRFVADFKESRERDLAVKAVNSHDQLVGVLKALGQHARGINTDGHTRVVGDDIACLQNYKRVLGMSRSALKAAGEKP